MLNKHELTTIINELPERPLLTNEKDIRLSLTNAQNKLPVLVVNKRIALPLHNAPSSHILKPTIRRVIMRKHDTSY